MPKEKTLVDISPGFYDDIVSITTDLLPDTGVILQDILSLVHIEENLAEFLFSEQYAQITHPMANSIHYYEQLPNIFVASSELDRRWMGTDYTPEVVEEPPLLFFPYYGNQAYVFNFPVEREPWTVYANGNQNHLEESEPVYYLNNDANGWHLPPVNWAHFANLPVRKSFRAKEEKPWDEDNLLFDRKEIAINLDFLDD